MSWSASTPKFTTPSIEMPEFHLSSVGPNIVSMKLFLSFLRSMIYDGVSKQDSLSGNHLLAVDFYHTVLRWILKCYLW
jgi:hypothetical protein